MVENIYFLEIKATVFGRVCRGGVEWNIRASLEVAHSSQKHSCSELKFSIWILGADSEVKLLLYNFLHLA